MREPMQFIDTHCHIHDEEFAAKYTENADELRASAHKEGVAELVCVGTDMKSSIDAVKFAATRTSVHASIALHPHEADTMSIQDCQDALHELEVIIQSAPDGVIAVGECGLDYYYHESAEVRDMQKYLFKLHIELALKYDLPLIFHIRDPRIQDEFATGQAFADFFEIIDTYAGVRGVVHSFSAGDSELQGVIKRGLYVGLNGIMTFSKQKSQINAAKSVPLESLLLETDAPFLTPKPFRGKICKPEHLVQTARFLSELRGETLKVLASNTTANAQKLFGI